MSNGEHLLPNRRRCLSYNDDRRVSEIQDDRIWIDYPQSESLFKIVDNMLSVPDRNQAPCLLIKGEGGTGKSSIIKRMQSWARFRERLVFIDLTIKPDGLKFPQLVAQALGVPANCLKAPRAIASTLPVELLQVIKLRKIKGILMDELQDAFFVPRNEVQRNLSIIKGLSNDPIGLSVIGLGTMAAENALKSDNQFFRRFHIASLMDWSETEDFRSFLAGIEETIPLKNPSHLDSEESIGFLLERTGGRMDDVVKIIRAAACYAIRSGEEKITLNLMRKAYADPWGY